MRLRARQHAPPSLEAADEFSKLELRVTNDLPIYLGAAGLLESDRYARISIPWLRQQGPADADWLMRFEGMISFARTHGWVDEARQTVRIHIVRESARSS